jgi:hypothetical protein
LGNEIFSEIHRLSIAYKDNTLNSIIKYPLVVIVFLSLGSCEKIPHYSNTPAIAFDGFDISRNVFNTSSQDTADVVIVKIKFQDGDGDLGLDSSDMKNTTTPNFILLVQPKNKFHKTDSVVYNGQFRPLTYLPKTIKGPVEGVLNYSLSFDYNNFYYINDTLTLFIHIVDRAGNVSNTIQTDPLVVHQQ